MGRLDGLIQNTDFTARCEIAGQRGDPRETLAWTGQTFSGAGRVRISDLDKRAT